MFASQEHTRRQKTAGVFPTGFRIGTKVYHIPTRFTGGEKMPTFDPFLSSKKSTQTHTTTGFEASKGITDPHLGLFCSGFIERFEPPFFFRVRKASSKRQFAFWGTPF